jgi:Cys-rich repeat protein
MGESNCPAGFACDDNLPTADDAGPLFTSVPQGLAGRCVAVCTDDSDCPNGYCFFGAPSPVAVDGGTSNGDAGVGLDATNDNIDAPTADQNDTVVNGETQDGGEMGSNTGVCRIGVKP